MSRNNKNIKKHQASWIDHVFDIFNYLALTIFALMCIYPFYYIFIYSISDPQKALFGIALLPAGFSLRTYETIFELNDIQYAFIVSCARTLIGTTITLFCCSILAYLFTNKHFIFRKFFYRLLVITMYLNAGLIPWYLLMKNIGLKDNFLLYVLPSAIIGFYVILAKTFFEQLSPAMEESALIDGAGYLAIIFRVILPLSKPVLAAIAVFSGVAQWNAFQDNYFLVNNEHLQTMQLVLYNYLRQSQIFLNMSANVITYRAQSGVSQATPESIKMCITILVSMPILLLYPLLQRFFVKGIMIGAIKG